MFKGNRRGNKSNTFRNFVLCHLLLTSKYSLNSLNNFVVFSETYVRAIEVIDLDMGDELNVKLMSTINVV